MKTLSLLLFVLLVVANVNTQAANFKYSHRPPDSIFDPTDVLTLQERKAISAPLDEIRKKERIDIIIVILPEIGDTPPSLLAAEFPEQWCQLKMNAVVLYVPGNPDSPWIFPARIISNAVKPNALKETFSAAQKRASAEPTENGKIRVAAIEAADALRYWDGSAVLVTENIVQSRLRAQFAYERRQRLYKLSAVFGAAAAIPGIAGLIFIFLRLKNSGSKRFPQTRKLTRLGAPYSGGNNASTQKH